jgi:hypothetical protein
MFLSVYLNPNYALEITNLAFIIATRVFARKLSINLWVKLKINKKRFLLKNFQILFFFSSDKICHKNSVQSLITKSGVSNETSKK